MVPHDYFFFTTKGFRDTSMTDYVGNVALMYAVNRIISQLQRNASGTIPYYSGDRSLFRIYCTAASPIQDNQITLCGRQIEWQQSPQVFITFNAVNTILNTTEGSRANLPQIGKKGRYPPLNGFDFFAIGGQPPRLIRIGKKQVQARVSAERLEVIKEEDDAMPFRPSHPVNTSDLESVQIEDGVLVRQFPPLIVDCNIRSRHYVCRQEGSNQDLLVAKPNSAIYSSVHL
jgi:CRISPR type I-D-associated protein Csc1